MNDGLGKKEAREGAGLLATFIEALLISLQAVKQDRGCWEPCIQGLNFKHVLHYKEAGTTGVRSRQANGSAVLRTH